MCMRQPPPPGFSNRQVSPTCRPWMSMVQSAEGHWSCSQLSEAVPLQAGCGRAGSVPASQAGCPRSGQTPVQRRPRAGTKPPALGPPHRRAQSARSLRPDRSASHAQPASRRGLARKSQPGLGPRMGLPNKSSPPGAHPTPLPRPPTLPSPPQSIPSTHTHSRQALQHVAQGNTLHDGARAVAATLGVTAGHGCRVWCGCGGGGRGPTCCGQIDGCRNGMPDGLDGVVCPTVVLV